MPLDPQPVREQLKRILASSVFTASERMSRFLRFAVEMALAGRSGELKEYVLGIEVFDRSESFDPRVDPIVRVEARRLRSKLKTYYDGAGRDDELIVEFPTGGYAPRFHLRGSEPAPAASRPGPASVVVLPFANLGGDPDSEYFSDGLTEELIHTLTKVEALRVVAWSSAVKLKDRQEDIRRIGEELGVGAVLSGSVRRAGDRLRITARLVDVSAGYYLWSEAYDRRIEDLFAIQQEIAAAIADSLSVKLLGPAARPAAASLEAYDLYLKGRFHWNKRTPDAFDRAIQYLGQAIALDPRCAAAYAGLADTYSLIADHGLASPATVMPQARAAALKALDIDPNLAEAHVSLGLIRSLYEWEWQAAGEHYRRAIRLNPGYVTGRHWFGCDYLALQGRFDEAIAEMREAVRLDPLSHVIIESLAYVLMLARRHDEALECHLEALELDPYFYKTYSALGRLYIHMDMPGQAIEMLHKARSLAGDVPNVLGALGQAYAVAGRDQEARGVLGQLEAMSTTRYVPSTTFALIHTGLGENQGALEWLETACERRELPLSAIKVHPGYAGLRGEPRFATLLTRIGLAD